MSKDKLLNGSVCAQANKPINHVIGLDHLVITVTMIYGTGDQNSITVALPYVHSLDEDQSG